MPPSVGAAERGRFTLGGLVVIIVALFLLGLLILALTHNSLGPHVRLHCQNNLSQIGKACAQYATAHRQRWPDVLVEPDSTHWNEVGNTRTDHYPPDGEPAAVKPGDNGAPVQSNTANLWVLVAQVFLTTDVCLCPASDTWPEETVVRFDEVRDFRNEQYVSYSFQNVLGPYNLTQTSADQPSRLAVAADASPLRRDFWSGSPGGVQEGATDRYLAKGPAFEQSEETEPWRGAGAKPVAWELSSPNHDFKGQNVLFLDCHVEWVVHPYCGPTFDNIWLRRRAGVPLPTDPTDIHAIRARNDTTSYDGTSTLPEGSIDDSFLVP